jgi:predicted RNase H-like HicB family nuclease
MKQHVQMNINLPFRVTRDNGWFLASCDVLDVHTQGKSFDSAKRNLVEALTLFLVSCYERGTLDAVLKECGFKALRKIPPKKRTAPPAEYINVPLPFVISQAKQSACHA